MPQSICAKDIGLVEVLFPNLELKQPLQPRLMRLSLFGKWHHLTGWVRLIMGLNTEQSEGPQKHSTRASSRKTQWIYNIIRWEGQLGLHTAADIANNSLSGPETAALHANRSVLATWPQRLSFWDLAESHLTRPGVLGILSHLSQNYILTASHTYYSRATGQIPSANGTRGILL